MYRVTNLSLEVIHSSSAKSSRLLYKTLTELPIIIINLD